MASITTILGTDSVSSSRIVINNNFASLNNELADISVALNADNGTLTLGGLISGGTLKISSNGGDLFRVNETNVKVNLPIEFDNNVIIKRGIIQQVQSIKLSVASLPSAGTPYNSSTYLLDASDFSNVISLSAAEEGQEITLIPVEESIILDNTNIFGPTQNVIILQNGSITLRYISGDFYIVSAVNCTITY
jgi:hypothetical protein